jgi:hypothetical protein
MMPKSVAAIMLGIVTALVLLVVYLVPQKGSQGQDSVPSAAALDARAAPSLALDSAPKPQSAKADAVEATAARRRYAKGLENIMLDKGLEVTVTAQGAAATTLDIEYALAGKVFAREVETNAEFWKSVCEAGFKEVQIQNLHTYVAAWNTECSKR